MENDWQVAEDGMLVTATGDPVLISRERVVNVREALSPQASEIIDQYYIFREEDENIERHTDDGDGEFSFSDIFHGGHDIVDLTGGGQAGPPGDSAGPGQFQDGSAAGARALSGGGADALPLLSACPSGWVGSTSLFSRWLTTLSLEKGRGTWQGRVQLPHVEHLRLPSLWPFPPCWGTVAPPPGGFTA